MLPFTSLLGDGEDEQPSRPLGKQGRPRHRTHYDDEDGDSDDGDNEFEDEEEDEEQDDQWVSLSFGSMLVRALVGGEVRRGADANRGGFFGRLTQAAGRPRSGGGAAAVACRAAGVLAHLLDGNARCKQRILRIPLSAPVRRGGRRAQAEGGSEEEDLLLPRCMRYLAELAISSGGGGGEPAAEAEWLQV